MKNKINKIIKITFIALALLLLLPSVMAVADLKVSSFSCTPSEVVINDIFSCTAQIFNYGDIEGSVTAATLYSDANDWLEDPTYTQASGVGVAAGQSTEVTFTGLKAVESGGSNSFDKIMLDLVEDRFTKVPGGAPTVNVINIIVTSATSHSSRAATTTFDLTAEVTAGGNIDVSLTFTANSGGCSVGSQANPKSIIGMNDGNKQSATWTVTQGSSGDCKYTITASATGEGGTATKSDTSTGTVTCSSGCSSGSSSSSGGGAGGGGASGAKTFNLGELTSPESKELSNGDAIKFEISGQGHILTLQDLTDISATITIESEEQTLLLYVGEEKKVDLNSDGTSEISVLLKSINLIEKKAIILLSPLSVAMPFGEGVAGTGKAVKEGGAGGIAGKVFLNKYLLIAILIFVVLATISFYYRHKIRNHEKGRGGIMIISNRFIDMLKRMSKGKIVEGGE